MWWLKRVYLCGQYSICQHYRALLHRLRLGVREYPSDCQMSHLKIHYCA